MAVPPSKSSSSSSGERPGAPLPEGLPLRPGGENPTGKATFMFVDFQTGGSEKAASFGRRERIFVHKRSHQQKKQASIERLRSRFPANRVALQETNTKGSEENPRVQNVKKKNTARPQVRSQEAVSLTAAPSQRYGDPFASFAIPMTGKLWMYLHHYRVRIINCSYPFDASQMQIWWVQKAMTSPAMLETCAFRAAEDKALVESIQGVSSDIIQKSINDSIYFRIKAIKALNNLLQDPAGSATHPTVLLVSALVSNEAFGANFEVLTAHQKGLKTLVSMMGGLDDLEHLMLSTIYQGALILAALQNTKPIFPMLQKFRDGIFHASKIFGVEGIQYKDCKIPASLSSLGIRFSTAPWHTQIHPTLKSLIEAFRRLIRHFEIGTLFPNVTAPTDNDLFVIIQHELLSTHYNHTTSNEIEKRRHRHKPNLNEPLRLSLMIYLYTRVSNFQDLPIMRCMVETFKQSLKVALAGTSLPSLNETAPDLLFWLLFIGGMASQGHSSHSWFVCHLAHVARILSLEDWTTEVQPLLAEFFYTDRPAHTGAEDLWSEVMLLTSSYRYIAPKPRLLVIEMD